MTKEEAKALVAQKVAGQDTNVDAGSVLPAILNFILDLLPGGGGESGLKVIVSTADWAQISREGVTTSTKAEAAQIAGISEDELDFLLNGGDLTPCLFVFGNNGGSPSNYWYDTKGVRRGHYETGVVGFTVGKSSVVLENGVYTILGFGE